MAKDPIHALVYADPGAGKSTLAATFPKPMLVYMFDPIGKDTPYVRAGEPAERIDGPYGPIRDIMTPTGAIRLEYFHDANVRDPSAWARFLQRHRNIFEEVRAGYWNTVVLDSITFASLSARKYDQFYTNATAKDPRQWYAAEAQEIEQVVMCDFAALPCNVVVCCHVSMTKDDINGEIVRTVKIRGQLKDGIAGAYGEFWKINIRTAADGQRYRAVQTQSDGRFAASTQIDAPNEGWPSYDALTANTPERR